MTNETDTYRYVEVTAEEVDGGRESYHKEVTVRAGETAEMPHLSNTDQLLRIAVVEDGEVDLFDSQRIGEDAQQVFVTITDDEIQIELTER